MAGDWLVPLASLLLSTVGFLCMAYDIVVVVGKKSMALYLRIWSLTLSVLSITCSSLTWRWLALSRWWVSSSCFCRLAMYDTSPASCTVMELTIGVDEAPLLIWVTGCACCTDCA